MLVSLSEEPEPKSLSGVIVTELIARSRIQINNGGHYALHYRTGQT